MKSEQDLAPDCKTPGAPVGMRDGQGDLRPARTPLWDAEYNEPCRIPVLAQARSELLALIEFAAPRESWHRLTSLVTLLLDVTEKAWTLVPAEDAHQALDLAWGLIANVSDGDWSKQSPEWVKSAENWRDAFYKRVA